MAASIWMIKAVRNLAPVPSNYNFLLRRVDHILLKYCCKSRVIVACRFINHESSCHDQKREANTKAITEAKPGTYSQLTLGGKVKQAGKDAYYTAIVIVGIGVTGLMFYAIFRELFSKTSPNSIYTQAYKECCQHPRVISIFGEPIKGYGELSARGRRRHVSHLEYIQDGVNHMRMKFYIEGSRKKGTVHLEVVENASRRFDYRYLFVEVNEFPSETIIIQDNRNLPGEISV